MYFAIKPINNSTYYNREALELIKNLQSLGVNATGRIGTDRQALQIAEYEKLKKTLSPTNEQQIQRAEVPFDMMIQEGAKNVVAADVSKGVPVNQNIDEVHAAVENRIGAEQLAKLNKFMLGIAA